MIGRSILANTLGGSWSAFLALVVIPFQIAILGVEAYGLLAFITSLQITFTIFDLGLSPTITREVATDSSPDFHRSRELIQTVSTYYLWIGVMLGIVLLLSSGWLATEWLNLKTLPTDSAALAIQLGAVVTILRWPVSFYTGIITGRQRFDLLNLLRAGIATCGLLGGLVVLVISSSLTTLIMWMALTAFVEVSSYLLVCFRLLPGLTLRPRFFARAMKGVWHYALGMNLLSVLVVVLVQSDRLFISRLLPIQALGYYSLAYNVLLGLTLVQGFVTSALFPAFASDHSLGKLSTVSSRYAKATQGLIYVYTLPIMGLVFFGHDILRLWTSAEAAEGASRIMAVLALGFLLNAAVSVPSVLAMATGNIRILIAINLVAVLFYIPGLYLLVARWGGLGAAIAWLLLNTYYLVSLLPLVHKHIVEGSTRAWLGRNLLPFLCCGVISFGVGRGIIAIVGWHHELATWAVCLVSLLTYGILGFSFLDPQLKIDIRNALRRIVATSVETR